MADFKLQCRLGTDPSDGNETYLVSLFNEEGELVGASGYNQNPATDYLCSEGQVYASYLASDADPDVYVGELNEAAHKLVAALDSAPVLWEITIQGDWEG